MIRLWMKDKKKMGFANSLNEIDSYNIEIMDFTILEDSQMREIFEKDIVEHDSERYVVFKNEEGQYYLLNSQGKTKELLPSIAQASRVIGNIYESPLVFFR